MKCAGDPVYFAKTYMKIVSLDEGLVQFKPYDFQEKLIRNFHENRFCLLYTSPSPRDVEESRMPSSA